MAEHHSPRVTPDGAPTAVSVMIGLMCLVPVFLKGQWQMAGLGVMLLLVGTALVVLAARPYPVPRGSWWTIIIMMAWIGVLAWNAWGVSRVQLESVAAWWWWVVGVAVAIVAMIWSSFHSWSRLLVRSIVVAGTVGALLAAIVYFESPAGRAGGLFYNANALGPFLLWPVMILIPFVFARPRRWFVLLAWAVALAMFALSVSVTSAVAATPVVLLTMILLRPRPMTKRWVLSVFAVFFITLVGWFSLKPIVTSRFLSASGATFSFSQRIEFMSTAWRMSTDKPWTGWGLGSFQLTSPRFTDQSSEQPRYVHNTYIQLLSEIGWPLTTIFIATIIIAGWNGWRQYRTETDTRLRQWRLALWLGWLAVTIAAGLDFGWYFPAVSIPWWLGTGTFLRWGGTLGPTPQVVRIGILFFALPMLWVGSQISTADLSLLRAHRAADSGRVDEYRHLVGASVERWPFRAAVLEELAMLRQIGTTDSRSTAFDQLTRFMSDNNEDYSLVAFFARFTADQGDMNKALTIYSSAYALDPRFHHDVAWEYIQLLDAADRHDEALNLARDHIKRFGSSRYPLYLDQLEQIRTYAR